MKVRVAGQSEFPYHLRMLVVGDHYVGKTALAQTAPAPLFVVFGNADKTTLAKEGSRYVEVTTEGEIMELKESLQSEDRDSLFGGPIETLVFDTIDELQRVLLVNRLNADRRINTSRDDWGWLGIRMNAIIRGMSSLDLNIIYLSETKVDEAGTIRPGLQGMFVDQIHNFVDMSSLLTVEPMEEEESSGPEIGDADIDDLPMSGDRHLFMSPLQRATWVGNTLTEHDVLRVSGDTLGGIIDELDVLREKLPATVDISDLSEEEESPDIDIPGMSSDEEISKILTNK